MKKKIPDIFDIEWNNEECEINEAVESGKNLKEEMAIAKKAATNYLRKEARGNIRISNSDLVRLKQRAAYKGLPYQTLLLVFYMNMRRVILRNN